MDETKIGKKKYHKGRHVEGAWLVSLIEDGSEDFRGTYVVCARFLGQLFRKKIFPFLLILIRYIYFFKHFNHGRIKKYESTWIIPLFAHL